jgi:hypothetical protein
MSARRSMMQLRWTVVHTTEETARRNGHADLLREAIDGTTAAHQPPTALTGHGVGTG